MKNKRFFGSLGMFIFLFSISYMGSIIYRPYIYHKHINDCHLADFFPNLLSVPIGYSFINTILLYFKKEIELPYKKIISATFGVILYEFLQLSTGGFDLLDIAATIIGAGSTSLFLYLKNTFKHAS